MGCFQEVTFELVEAVSPHLPIRLEPAVELDQRLKPDAVQTALAIGANMDEPGVAKHAEVLRHGRLTNGQPLDQCTNRALSAAQLIEDLSPAGLGDDLHRGLSGHGDKYYPMDICLSRHEQLFILVGYFDGTVPTSTEGWAVRSSAGIGPGFGRAGDAGGTGLHSFDVKGRVGVAATLGGWVEVGRDYRFGPTSDQGLATVQGRGGDHRFVYRGGWSIPGQLRAEGWDHIGDPDGYDDLIFDAYQTSSNQAKMFAVTGPDGLIHSFRHQLTGDELANNSFAAVSPDGHWLVSGEWGQMRRLLVFPTPLINPMAPVGAVDLPWVASIQLDHDVRNVQGAVFIDERTLLCSTDDPSVDLWGIRRQLLEVRLDATPSDVDVSGQVTCLGALPLVSLCPGTFEVEGLDFDRISGVLRVAIVPPPPCKLLTTIVSFERRPSV